MWSWTASLVFSHSSPPYRSSTIVAFYGWIISTYPYLVTTTIPANGYPHPSVLGDRLRDTFAPF